MPLRFDAVTPTTWRKTPEGYFITEGKIRKPGVLVYDLPDGRKYRELVDERTLSNFDSLMQKPIVVDHPKEGKVNSRNIKRLSVGHATNCRHDAEGALIADMIVQAHEGIQAIVDGKSQLSAAYDVVELDRTPGEHAVYGRYDARQIRCEYNHTALCNTGRAGPDCALRLDSADGDQYYPLDEATPMKSIALLLGLAALATEEECCGAITGLKTRMDSAEKERDKEKSRADSVAADLTKFRTDSAADIPKLVEERVSLLPLAARYRVDAAKHPVNGDLIKAIALAAQPEAAKDQDVGFCRGILAILPKQDAYTGWRPDNSKAQIMDPQGGGTPTTPPVSGFEASIADARKA